MATVPEHLAQAPLEACVKTLFDMSWNEARRAIASGKIRIGDQVSTDSRAVPGLGAELQFNANAPRVRPQLVDVVYEDESVIVVNKPSGLITVPFDDPKEDSFDARVRAHLSAKQRGPKNVRPELGVVHRIDKETSGLVVFTRTWQAKQSLAEQFREHTVWRRYLAIVVGEAKGGTMVTQIGRDRGDGKRGSVERGGERAVTHIEVMKHLGSLSLVACRLETGRTHQIRIHLSERGTPVLGDRVYGHKGAARLMLHAKELGFVHPVTGKEVRFDSTLPADMQAVLERQA